MYAWRARIGLIKPTHRGKSFHFWYKRAPDGVEIVPTFVGFRRSDRQTFENAFERIEQIAEDLKAVGCDIVSLSGTPPVLLKGLDFEREWRDRLSQKLALPVVSQMEPHALALVALGVKRVAIATYYGDELNNAIKRYFAPFDIEGVVIGGLSVPGKSGGAVYDLADGPRRSLPHAGLSILQGGLPGDEAAGRRYLHQWRRLGCAAGDRNVGARLAAQRWCLPWRRKCGRTYQRLAIDPVVGDCGALLRDNPAVPSA